MFQYVRTYPLYIHTHRHIGFARNCCSNRSESEVVGGQVMKRKRAENMVFRREEKLEMPDTLHFAVQREKKPKRNRVRIVSRMEKAFQTTRKK